MDCEKTTKIMKSVCMIDKKNRVFGFYIIFVGIFLLAWGNQNIGHCLGWTDVKTRLLPDDSFAVIESMAGTQVRHCPHHDLNGYIDIEQLIFVLGTLDTEKWLNPKNKTVAKKHLQKHYEKFKSKALKKGLNSPVNINEANLTELVLLPHIGPVLAVKIVEYRETKNMFISIEDIKNVEGIGQGTFNAIRHYICTD